MKDFLNTRLLILISLALLCLSVTAYPQDKKNKARVSLQYTKIMNKESFIGISAKYKSESGFEQISDLELKVYEKISDDSLIYIGETKTNMDGKTKFILTSDVLKKEKDETAFTYVVKIENNKKFEDGETSVGFSDAGLIASIKLIDSVNQISAVLTDASGNAVQGQSLKVGLKRLYGSLQIGDDSYVTNENGAVTVPIIEKMPGVNGNLVFEIVLNESDVYGTIKTLVSAPIGIPIIEESTFDQRTLWAPPAKAPIYLLVFPALIMLGVWIPLFILLFNLYRISTSKTN